MFPANEEPAPREFWVHKDMQLKTLNKLACATSQRRLINCLLRKFTILALIFD